MSQIVRQPAPLPQPSPGLEEAIRGALNPHPEVGIGPVSVAAQQEAAALLPAMDVQLRAATAEEWERFLKPLARLPNGPATREEFAASVGLIAFALNDMPASLLTPDNQREALRRFTFWPKPAEIHEWLGPEARRLRARRSALARIVAAKPAPTPATEPATRTPEEIEAVRAKAEAFRAEMASRVQRVVPAAKARELVGHTLLAAWERAEADGVPGAALRVARLRQQLGMEAAA